MGYDLALFGGSGQWVLLDLLLRQLRGESVTLPDALWIIDPHQPDATSSVPALVKKAERDAGISAMRIRPKRDNVQTATFEAILNEHLTPSASYERLRTLIEASMTNYERSYSTERGFYALPRLAASWIALAGFEPEPAFLQDAYLRNVTPANNLLVICGSLAGGTGAGLIPQVLLRTRSDETVHWKRDVLVHVMLPWFNPELARHSGNDTVRWSQCAQNAADGVRALNRICTELATRIPGGQADLPTTRCSVVSLPPESARNTPPPDHEQVALSGVAPAFIRATVDSLLHMVVSRSAEAPAEQQKVVMGPAPIRIEAAGTDPFARYARRDGFVAAQLKALAEEVARKKDSVHSQGTVSLHRGFGRTLGDLFVARALTGYTSRTALGANAWTTFWNHWLEQITVRTDSLDDSDATGLASADVSTTLKIVDRSFKDERARAELLASADVPAASSATAGQKVADRIVNALIVATATSDSSKGAPLFARLVPPSVMRRTAGDAGAQLAQFQRDEIRDLADAFQRSTFLEFHGSSYARTFGQVHKLADLIRDTNPQILAQNVGSAVLDPIFTLWRAAMRGMLRFDSHQMKPRDPIVERLNENENLRHDFGEIITTVSFQGTTVGYLSLELGFVPHVELLDDLAEEQGVRAAFDRCGAALPHDIDDDMALLHALGVYATETLGASPEMAWAKLLQAAPVIAGVDNLLDTTLPSQPIPLRAAATGSTVHLPLPRIVDRAVLDALRDVNRTSRSADLVQVTDDRLMLVALGEQAELARLAIVSGKKYVTSFASDAIRDAGRYVEAGGAAVPRIVVEWR